MSVEPVVSASGIPAYEYRVIAVETLPGDGNAGNATRSHVAGLGKTYYSIDDLVAYLLWLDQRREWLRRGAKNEEAQGHSAKTNEMRHHWAREQRTTYRCEKRPMVKWETFDPPRDWYVVCCRICDGDNVPMPIPFPTPEARGGWCAEHTKGTGHDSWLVIDDYAKNR